MVINRTSAVEVNIQDVLPIFSPSSASAVLLNSRTTKPNIVGIRFFIRHSSRRFSSSYWLLVLVLAFLCGRILALMGNFLFYSVQCSVLIRSTTLNSLIFLDLTSNKRTKTVHFCAQLSSIIRSRADIPPLDKASR
jgi:hypothetical protein